MQLARSPQLHVAFTAHLHQGNVFFLLKMDPNSGRSCVFVHPADTQERQKHDKLIPESFIYTIKGNIKHYIHDRTR